MTLFPSLLFPSLRTKQVLGRRVAFMISDPWEFGTACGPGPFYCRIADVDKERMLLTLEGPVHYAGEALNSMSCQVRHNGTSTYDIDVGRPVSMNLVLMSAQVARLSDIKADEFRSGVAAVGTVELA